MSFRGVGAGERRGRSDRVVERIVERRATGGDEHSRPDPDQDEQDTDDPAHAHRSGEHGQRAGDDDQRQRRHQRLRVGARDGDRVRGESLGLHSRLDPGAGRGEEREATAAEQHQHDRGVQAPRGHSRRSASKQVRVAGVAGRPVLVDEHEHGVAVAVEPHLAHLLDVARTSRP